MIQQILLDLDGVLSDFLSLALQKLEAKRDEPVAPLTSDNYHVIGKFDIAEVYGISANEFWQTIEHKDEFWCNLQPFPWAKDLLSWLQGIAPVTICTSPSLHPVCLKQKVEWCMKHLDLRSNELMIGGRKYLMAKPEHVLIDDYPKNCLAFGAAGGRAICVPSNWNTPKLSYAIVRHHIESCL